MGSYVVRSSPVAGLGLFAGTAYREGDLIGEYQGRLIDRDMEGETSSALHPDPSYTLLFAIDDKRTIDAGAGGNDIRFINHSCDPNCETSVDEDRVFVNALRDIEPGEELTYDYSLRPGDPSDSPEDYRCNCGAANCRATMLDLELVGRQ